MTKRLLTGDRPTGRLHLGHYVGTLANRVKLHREYESFFIIADLHMLTTKNSREDVRASAGNAREMVLDALSVGIDPERATFFLQSAVEEISDLNTLFQNLVSVSRLERVPSLKDMSRDAGIEMPYGLLGYPVLQAADILCVRAEVVPVGKDNASHVEVAREIARRFNALYGSVLPVPELVLGDIPQLVGTDGKRKMSKSLNNVIFLSDAVADVERKVRRMYTDERRVHADVPGIVDGNPVFAYHDAFNDDAGEVADLKRRYEVGRVGDVEVKQSLVAALDRFLTPIRERRASYESMPGFVDELVVDGTLRTRAEARATVQEVRKAMGLTSTWNSLRRKAEQRSSRTVPPRSSS